MRGCAGPSAPWSPAAAPQAAPPRKPRREASRAACEPYAARRTPHRAPPRRSAPRRDPPRRAPRLAPPRRRAPRRTPPAPAPCARRPQPRPPAAMPRWQCGLRLSRRTERVSHMLMAYPHSTASLLLAHAHRPLPCYHPPTFLPSHHLIYHIIVSPYPTTSLHHLATLQGAATDEHVVQYGGPTPGTIPFRYANKNLPVCASDAKTHAPSRHCTAYTSRPCIYLPCTYVHAGWAAALRAACGAAARISRSVIRANHVRGDVCELPYVLATPRMC